MATAWPIRQDIPRAANYAKNKLTEWGVQNATLDPWGEFGKGWELEKMYFAMTAPYYKPMMVYPKTLDQGYKGIEIRRYFVGGHQGLCFCHGVQGQTERKDYFCLTCLMIMCRVSRRMRNAIPMNSWPKWRR